MTRIPLTKTLAFSPSSLLGRGGVDVIEDVPVWMSTGGLSREELERVSQETSRDDNLAFEEKPIEDKFKKHDGGKVLESKLEWDVDANETGTVNQKCLCQSFSPDGRMIAVGTTGGGT